MKKLFANISYSFNNFYDSLNPKGQIIFSIISILLILLCVLMIITKIIDFTKKTKKAKVKEEKTEINTNTNIIEEEIKVNKENKEYLYKNEKTEIEDIAQRVEEALRDDAPISLTSFEEDQEKTAIISIDELMKRAKELELIDDEEGNINYLEKYNLEPSEMQEVVDKVVKEESKQEVKAFKVSQVISPVYGIKKEVVEEVE